jgi:hypothetical protein
VGAHRAGEDLHGDVWLGTECVQVLQLLAYDVGTADGTAQRRFLQGDPKAQRGGWVVDSMLTAQPNLEAPGGLFGSDRGESFPRR